MAFTSAYFLDFEDKGMGKRVLSTFLFLHEDDFYENMRKKAIFQSLIQGIGGSSRY